MKQINKEKTYLYYLDDDNLIHPNLYRLLNVIDNDKFYSFNQYKRLKGNDIRVSHIDTAMVIIPYKLCKNQRWVLDKYESDGIYIKECYDNNKGKHVFVSLVSPYKDQRDKFKSKMGDNLIEVYVHTTEVRGREDFFVKDYQPPTENYLDIDTTNISVDVCKNLILQYEKNSR